MTREEHRENVLSAVRSQQRQIEHGDDWAHVLLLDLPDENREVLLVPGPRELGLTMMMATLRSAVVKHGAIRWAHVMPAYIAPEAGDRETPVRDRPNKTEIVNVLIGDTDPWGAVEEHVADVHRPPRKRPVLGPWRQVEPQDGAIMHALTTAVRSGVAARG